MEDNYLSHHGVKGMKWGKRKNYYGQSGDKFKASNGVTVGAPKCTKALLLEQKRYMSEYIRCLQVRAEVEGIELE